jgi:superfamily II DNA or RNA helicase
LLKEVLDFQGDSRANQIAAVKALAAHNEGVLCAPTAFGKTAVAARLIALRRVNTLVLVHRRQLMDQWRGLTATPVRKDGHHPIILMQCGPIRFNVSSKKQASASALQYEVTPRVTEFTVPPEWNEIGIQDIYTALVHDDQRSDLIVSDVVAAIEERRFPLLLTERTDHLDLLFEKLARRVPNIFVMKGGTGKKQRDATAVALNAVPEGQPRVILATGRYIGEGFDDARLDTLFLAMPISWRGTLQQYVGRLHRLHADKRIVRVYDYVDASVPVLKRMYEKRLKAYEAVGYTVVRPSEPAAQADLRFATIERIAVQAVVAFEEARGCKIESSRAILAALI